MTGKAKGFPGYVFGNPVDFVEDPAGFDNRHPFLGASFSTPHACLSRLGREGLVREDPDPDFPAAFHVAGDGDTAGLDLAVGDPDRFQGLQAVSAKTNKGAARTSAGQPAAMLFPVFDFLWL